MLLIVDFLQIVQIVLGVYLHNSKILLKCRQRLDNSVLSTIGHCVKYIGEFSANYLWPIFHMENSLPK
jgi:hypothetical protein